MTINNSGTPIIANSNLSTQTNTTGGTNQIAIAVVWGTAASGNTITFNYPLLTENY